MRTIHLNNGQEFGTNTRDGGLFSRRTDGTWGQWKGNSQTPFFRDGRQFWAWLKRHYDFEKGTRLVRRDF